MEISPDFLESVGGSPTYPLFIWKYVHYNTCYTSNHAPKCTVKNIE